MNLNNAYELSEKIIIKHSKSFYLAFKDLPPAKKLGVFAVYGFCREVDDAIDELQDETRLRDYAQALHHLDTMDAHNPIMWALADTIARFKIPLMPFMDMIYGQQLDLNFKAIPDEAALLRYCYYVASSVGLMLLPILATQHHEKIKTSGIQLGYAMQLTNILRDVGEDFHEKNRIYLPQSLLSKDVLQAIQTKEVNSAFIAVWERLAQCAENYYEIAIRDIKYYDEDSKVAITRAIVYYRGILDAVRAQKYDCLSQRCRVTDIFGLQKEVDRIIAALVKI